MRSPLLLRSDLKTTPPVPRASGRASNGPSRTSARRASRITLSTLEPPATGAQVRRASPSPAVREGTGAGEVSGGNTKGRAVEPGLSDPVV
jgi:hypothetical protein